MFINITSVCICTISMLHNVFTHYFNIQFKSNLNSNDSFIVVFCSKSNRQIDGKVSKMWLIHSQKKQDCSTQFPLIRYRKVTKGPVVI